MHVFTACLFTALAHVVTADARHVSPGPVAFTCRERLSVADLPLLGALERVVPTQPDAAMALPYQGNLRAHSCNLRRFVLKMCTDLRDPPISDYVRRHWSVPHNYTDIGTITRTLSFVATLTPDQRVLFDQLGAQPAFDTADTPPVPAHWSGRSSL